MTFNPDSIEYKKHHFVNGEFRSEKDGTFDYIRPSDQKVLDDVLRLRVAEKKSRNDCFNVGSVVPFVNVTTSPKSVSVSDFLK